MKQLGFDLVNSSMNSTDISITPVVLKGACNLLSAKKNAEVMAC